MDERTKQQIAEVMGDLSCAKGFRCAETGFRELCEAEDIGLENHLKCLAPNASRCQFSVMYDRETFFCCCPLRVFLAKHAVDGDTES